jgi:hypothetical protein
MNIKKLKIGQTYKNYKELCLELGIEIKASTNSKNAQLRELSRYCKYNKVGHKFFIEEVYSTPLPHIENRGKTEGSRNNNSVYGEMVQLLILDLLAQCRKGHLSISRSKLMLTINMINENYGFCGEQVKKLGEYAEIEEGIIYDFYNTSNSNFKSVIEKALNNLMDKRIIWYDMITKVCEMGTRIHRLATQEEKEIIRDSEKLILDELGYKQVSQVRCSKHWKLFKGKVKNLLNENGEIEYYYFAYDIYANEKYLQEERKELLKFLLEQVEREEYKGELNATVYYNLIENAKKRHEKGFTSQKMSKYRLQDNYIEDIIKLVELLIDNSTGDITEYVSKIDIEDYIDNCEIEEELEILFA